MLWLNLGSTLNMKRSLLTFVDRLSLDPFLDFIVTDSPSGLCRTHIINFFESLASHRN